MRLSAGHTASDEYCITGAQREYLCAFDEYLTTRSLDALQSMGEHVRAMRWETHVRRLLEDA